MKKAEDRLNEEQNRVSRYLHETTGPKLIRIVEGELIHMHAQALVNMENSGCVVMFRDDKKNDLARLYRLFRRVSTKTNKINNIKSFLPFFFFPFIFDLLFFFFFFSLFFFLFIHTNRYLKH